MPVTIKGGIDLTDANRKLKATQRACNYALAAAINNTAFSLSGTGKGTPGASSRRPGGRLQRSWNRTMRSNNRKTFPGALIRVTRYAKGNTPPGGKMEARVGIKGRNPAEVAYANEIIRRQIRGGVRRPHRGQYIIIWLPEVQRVRSSRGRLPRRFGPDRRFATRKADRPFLAVHPRTGRKANRGFMPIALLRRSARTRARWNIKPIIQRLPDEIQRRYPTELRRELQRNAARLEAKARSAALDARLNSLLRAVR